MTNTESGKRPVLEMLPAQQQAANFSALYNILLDRSIRTSIPGRLALLDAFRNLPADSPIKFLSRATIMSYTEPDSAVLDTSELYRSSIPRHATVETNTAYYGTVIAALTPSDGPQIPIMRILRFADDPVYGARNSYTQKGLYMAMSPESDEISYFGVKTHPAGGGRLQLIEDLPDQLKIPMMHDVQTALGVMTQQ